MNCFELFAGCGGLGYGFHNEGFNIVAANELCEKIASTYKHNFPNNFNLKGTKIVLDCANGAAYKSAPKLLSDLGAKIIA